VLTPAPVITCIDCGGRAHLLTHPREDGEWLAGDIVAYRCEDCLDRWDLVLDEDDDDGTDAARPFG
jgi:predicted nucleic acid-binding Zn ribbon protein